MKTKLWFSVSALFLLLVLIFIATTSSLAAKTAADAGRPADEFVARVYYNDIADVQKLMTYDVYEYNNLQEKYVLVAMNTAILQKLRLEGWRVSIDWAVTDQLRASQRNINTFSGGYRTTAEVYTDLTTINTTYPGLTEIVDYGDSYCKGLGGCTTPGGQFTAGHDLKAMRVTNEAIPGPKPVFFFMANIHAREITTPELAMRFINWLTDGYGVDADATWLVDYHEIWVVPVVNPDGHWIVELGPYYQRKNANPSNGCSTFWPPTSSSQYGIDLNRNHSFMWNTGGTSTNPCNQTYLGPSAASEPEVSQLQTQVLSLIADQRGPGINDPAPQDTTGILITLHSYSELVLWPWGNTTNPAPNKAGLEAIGDKFATYNGYTSCQPSVCLYLTSGTSDDWAYGELGIPSYTFEVGTAFMPTYSTVDNVQWPENKPAFIYAAKIARTPYMLVNGPDALSLTASVSGTNLTVNGSINDSSNGNQPVAAAVYYVDTPPWAGGVSGNLNPTDGTFNSAVESVNGTIDVSGLSNGQHILFVQGQDNTGNWGPFSAVFFQVGSTPGNTGYKSPTANSAVTSSAGDNNGFQTNPTNAYSDDGLFAVDTNSGNGASTSCTSTRKDKHLYFNYTVGVAGGLAIDGIEVRLDGKVDSTSGAPKFCVQLSWDGGATWTTAKTTATLTTGEATYTLGSAADTWGRAWNAADFLNGNFRVRIIPIASNTSRDFSLDWVAVRVSYH